MSVTASASAEPAAGLSPATTDDATQLAGMLARSFESCPAWGAFLPADSKRRLERMARCFGFMLTGLRHLPRTIACFNAMDAGHPTEPHWYLSVLGVEPAARKAGVAETLILAGLERCDRERRPAQTETGRPRSRDFYAEHGFEVTKEFKLPGDGPPVWRLWREPRTED